MGGFTIFSNPLASAPANKVDPEGRRRNKKNPPRRLDSVGTANMASAMTQQGRRRSTSFGANGGCGQEREGEENGGEDGAEEEGEQALGGTKVTSGRGTTTSE